MAIIYEGDVYSRAVSDFRNHNLPNWVVKYYILSILSILKPGEVNIKSSFTL